MAKLPDKRASFIEWYLEAIDRAQVTDKRYPVKGMNVWTRLGFKARRALDAILIREIEATGSEPVEFPALIPQTEFQKEKEHIKGFDEQVYWVTKGGTAELDIPLVLRPTSETAMYPVFALWIRSHRDLPLNVYQIANTFRYETKTTRPFLRVREIHFFEEHTCQTDEARATERVQSNLQSFARMAEALAMPYLPIRRPEWDKFPGAYFSVALDIPVGDARTLQIGSIHHYQENFARPFGITYEDVLGHQRFVHQTTFGLSERLVGAVVGVHGDSKGAVFPSSIAPVQVVVIPIVGGNEGEASDKFAHAICDRVQRRGLRCTLDASDERPGAKYYRWEERGVPLRLEVGKREAASATASGVDRLGLRTVLGPERIEEAVVAALAAFDARLFERARSDFRESFEVAHSVKELAGSTKVRVLPWCGSETCGHAIETAIDGALLGIPEGDLPIPLGSPGPCAVCQKTETKWAIAGRPL